MSESRGWTLDWATGIGHRHRTADWAQSSGRDSKRASGLPSDLLLSSSKATTEVRPLWYLSLVQTLKEEAQNTQSSR